MPFFAHSEHVIIVMLGDENKPVRDIVVNKIMSLRETLTAGHTDIFKETSCEEVKGVRKFKVPSTNKKATSYYQLVNLCLDDEPPLSHRLTNDKLKNLCSSKQPCHNQLLKATFSWSLKQPLLRQVLEEEMVLSAK